MARSSKAVRPDPLTERELEILSLLAEGLTNRDIARTLILSLETIKWYNRQIYAKLDVGNRNQAVARARQLGLFDAAGDANTAVLTTTLHNLPAPVSSFVGRQQEIAEIRRLLSSSRLVTLTGPGGAGKTRLGLAVAASVVGDYAQGVFFVSLLAASSESQVPEAVAQVLGVTERPDQALLATLQRYLQSKQILLLLDNFEHVQGAAPLVTDLLSSAPRLTILVTSREALSLSGEHEYLVPPLRLPDPAQVVDAADLSAAESVTLFVQRARAASASFALTDENATAVAGICLRVDGLPLAIELAAARIKLFSPQQLLDRLHSRLGLLVGGPRDLPARQRTLRDTIDWSYNLLDETEKVLFARLAVFRNGRSLEAVEAVCSVAPVGDPSAGLSSLLDKSLLYQAEGPAGAPRFFMLETIREYARERLAAGGEDAAMRNRHLAYFLALATAMEPGFRRHNQQFLLKQTEIEMGNLRAAFAWAMQSNQVDAAARLVSAVDYYFRYKDSTDEGYRWTQSVLDRLDEVSRPYRCRFLLAAARLAWQSGQIQQASSLAQQGLALARQEQDRYIEAWLLVEMALAVFEESEKPSKFVEAVKRCQEAQQIFAEFGDQPGIAYALNVLGEAWRAAGEFDRAREAYEMSLAVCDATGEQNRQCLLLADLAIIAYGQGNYEQAHDLSVTFLKKLHGLDLRLWFLIGLAGLAGSLGKLGAPDKAARLLGASTAMLGTMGVPYPPSDQREVARYLADIRAQLDEDAFTAAWEEGQAMTLQQAVAYALEE